MYKIGDKVRVTNFISLRNWDVQVGDVFQVARVDSVGDVYVSNLENQNRLLVKSEIEKVEENKEMTFPEMVQKLIDGEFEVDTELVVTDSDEWTKDYKVVNNKFGYGITNPDIVGYPTIPSRLNGKWEVKEQPIKEMSIEELQKELGYKIKIVEQESK